MMALIVFYLLAAMAVGSALLTITRRNPVASAGWLVATMLALAGIYLLLNAQFVALVQVLVYAGAVMVLFLFVLMLLNLGTPARDFRGWVPGLIALGLAGALAAELVSLGRYRPERLVMDVAGAPAALGPKAVLAGGDSLARLTEAKGAIQVVAEPLFRTYLLPFEITSVLLLAAAVGAVVLAKRKL